MIRVVADTNTILSGFLWKGLPGKFLDLAINQHFLLLSSLVLFEELEEVVNRPKFSKTFEEAQILPNDLLTRFRTFVEMIDITQRASVVIRDLDDIPVLNCALSGKADYIVTGDKDLLVLEQFHDISIVTVREFLSKL
jgi:putative PIN family toxin of toxin-antitoxin system